MPYYVYTLRCKDGTYYTGYTPNLRRRVQAHQNGTAAKYTRGRGPLQLVRVRAYATKSEAMRAESLFKKLKRRDKEARMGIKPVTGGADDVDTTKCAP
ncbi:MAG TPA: GIY-YIG nuclease family protein [Bacillales bacterium]|nr:GIY-YIG nuclease family protein [Bacillales bacterium]